MTGRRGLSALTTVALVLSSTPSALARFTADPVTADVTAFLVSKQTREGTFFSEEQPAYATAEAVVSVQAGDGSEGAVSRALQAISSHGQESSDRGGRVGLIILGIVAAGGDPRDLGGFNYVGRLDELYNPATGSYDDKNLYSHALGIIGKAASGGTVPGQAILYLSTGRCGSGGLSHTPGCVAGDHDVDTTSLGLMALISAGIPRNDERIAAARRALVDSRNAEGGFGQFAGEKTNANSTAMALAAISSLDEDPRAAPWTDHLGGPLQQMKSLTTPSGGIRYAHDRQDVDQRATVQGLLGLSGWPLPVRHGPRIHQAKGNPASDVGNTGPSSLSENANTPTHQGSVPSQTQDRKDGAEPRVAEDGHVRSLQLDANRGEPDGPRGLPLAALATLMAALATLISHRRSMQSR